MDNTAHELASRPLRAILRRPAVAALAVGATVAQLATVLPIPVLIKQIFDEHIPDGDRGSLVTAGTAVVVLFVLSAIINVAIRIKLLAVAQEVVREARVQLFGHLHALPQRAVERRGHRDLHDLLLLESERLSELSTVVLGDLGPAIMLTAGLSVLLFAISWQLFLVAALFAPPLIVVNIVLSRWMEKRQRDLNQAIADYSTGTVRTLDLLSLTRVRAAERAELERQNGLSTVMEHTANRAGVVRISSRGAQQAIVLTSALVALVAGGLLVIDDTISLGTLFSFYAGIALLRPALDQIIVSQPSLIIGRVATQRIHDFLSETPARPYLGEQRIDFSGAITMSEVEFAYDQDPVLGPLDLSLQPGELTVLTGPNGSGKSTAVSLLCGLYRPTSGELLADGVPFDTVAINDVRGAMGVVFQNPHILDGSVRDNVTYGVDASHEDVERACRLATFDEVVTLLEDGLDTQLGDAGRNLSGGQFQRLAIARALVGSPRLLILDEPTNHLDAQTLTRVLRNLRQLSDGPAILIVSHEPQVLDLADQIVALPHQDRRGEGPTVTRRPRSAAGQDDIGR